MFINMYDAIYQNITEIILEAQVWERNVNSGQTVEEVLTGSLGPTETLSLCKESGQGETIAFGNNVKGFYTISEASDENEEKEVNVPIFYYSLNIGDLKHSFHT